METAELVRDRRYVWDACNLREVDQAKAEILAYKRKGYPVLKADGTPMERFSPALEEVLVLAKKIGGHVLKILCDKGDERVVWDKENGQQALQAKEKFKQLLGQGYKAYSVDAHGKKHRKIEEFDIDAEEILMVPPTAKG